MDQLNNQNQMVMVQDASGLQRCFSQRSLLRGTPTRPTLEQRTRQGNGFYESAHSPF